MEIEVTSGVLAVMIAQAERSAPQECCGILLGQGRRIVDVVHAKNVHPSPKTHFEIDPAALIMAHRAARQGGPEVFGYYHSHPAGHPLPSATDCEHASGDGRVWAIVASGEVAWWRDGPSGFEALPYRIIDG